jgi:tetratricopeptide (TPR) repeat protein
MMKSYIVRAMLIVSLIWTSAAHAQEQLATTPASREIRKLINSKKTEEAYEQAKTQTSLAPNSAEAYYWLGSAAGIMAQEAGLLSKLSYAKACKTAFEKAASLDPKHIATRFALIQFHRAAPGMAGGDKDRIPVLVKEITAADPIAGLRAQAMVKQMDKDLPGAEKLYLQALQLNPADADSVEALAGGYMQNKKFADAGKAISAALTKSPDNIRLQYQSAKLSALTGENSEAGLVILDRILAMPTPPETLSMAGVNWRRALILEKLGRAAEAKTAIAKAVELAPDTKEIKADAARIKKL